MKSPSSTPERLLVTGLAGAGKSETWVQIAAQIRASGDDNIVYVINADTAGSVERCNERYDDWQTNIVHTDVRDWRQLTTTTSLYTQLAQPGDWIVIDPVSWAWEAVRDAYVDQRERRGGRVPDFQADPFATVNTDITGPEYNTQINPAYARWYRPLINDTPAHILLTAPSQPIKVQMGEKGWGDDKQIIEEFGRFGVRPSGQKHTIFTVHDALLLKHTSSGYTITSMKSRSRELLTDAPLANFPLTFLCAVAGWSL